MAFLFDRVSLWRNAPLASLQRNVLVPRARRRGKYRTYLASDSKSSPPASHPPSPWVSLSHTHTGIHTHTHAFCLLVQRAGTGACCTVLKCKPSCLPADGFPSPKYPKPAALHPQPCHPRPQYLASHVRQLKFRYLQLECLHLSQSFLFPRQAMQREKHL